jgi:hypothetical protein
MPTSSKRVTFSVTACLAVLCLAAPPAGLAQRAFSTARNDVRTDTVEERFAERPEPGPSDSAPRREFDRVAREELRRAFDNLQENIQSIELESGPNANDLIEPLTAVGALYQDLGQPILSSAAIERAIDVLRYNRGLHSLDQAPLIRRLIANAKSIGDHADAWELEQELLVLAGRHPEDLRTARILRETADGRMDVLRRYTAGEMPPEIYLGCYYRPAEESFAERIATARGVPRECYAGSRGKARRRLVGEAEAYYAQSVNVLISNEHFASDELPELFEELVQSSYLYGSALGRRSLTYLRAYQVETSAPAIAQIETLVQMADWDLYHAWGRNANDEALARYADAYERLEEEGAGPGAIQRIFSPEIPIIIPTFLPNPLITVHTDASRRYIDVSFEITKYGKARDVKILGTTSYAKRDAKRRLVQLLLRRRFRPIMTDGEFADTGPIVLRYYITDSFRESSAHGRTNFELFNRNVDRLEHAPE